MHSSRASAPEGQMTGVGEILRRKFPGIYIAAVEPEESAVLSGGKPHVHEIQGIGAGFVPEILNREIYDEVIRISGKEAKSFTRELAVKGGTTHRDLRRGGRSRGPESREKTGQRQERRYDILRYGGEVSEHRTFRQCVKLVVNFVIILYNYRI